jgi:predicted ATPase
LRKATSKTNILVATQSSELVRWLKPEELVIANGTPEGTTFTPATSKPDLNRWLEDFTLSELWLMGELGGRL